MKQSTHDLMHMLCDAKRWILMAKKVIEKAEKWVKETDEKIQEIAKDDANN